VGRGELRHTDHDGIKWPAEIRIAHISDLADSSPAGAAVKCTALAATLTATGLFPLCGPYQAAGMS